MGKSKNRGTARAVRAKRCLGEDQEPAPRGTGRRRLRQLVQRGGARPGGRRGRSPHRGYALPPQLAQDALLRLRAQIGAGGMAVGRARRIQGKATAFRQRRARASCRARGGWRLPTSGSGARDAAPLPMPLRTGYGGFEGSPLDPRLSFTSFVVGASNRLAYAAAQEVASAFSTPQALFNPLFLHGNVGLGQDPPPARDLLGREAAEARGRGALSHRRALHERLRAGLARTRCPRLQGEAAGRSTSC